MHTERMTADRRMTSLAERREFLLRERASFRAADPNRQVLDELIERFNADCLAAGRIDLQLASGDGT